LRVAFPPVFFPFFLWVLRKPTHPFSSLSFCVTGIPLPFFRDPIDYVEWTEQVAGLPNLLFLLPALGSFLPSVMLSASGFPPLPLRFHHDERQLRVKPIGFARLVFPLFFPFTLPRQRGKVGSLFSLFPFLRHPVQMNRNGV